MVEALSTWQALQDLEVPQELVLMLQARYDRTISAFSALDDQNVSFVARCCWFNTDCGKGGWGKKHSR